MMAETVAVAGIGSIGLRHLKVLNSAEGVTAVAVSRRPEQVQQLAAAGYRVAEDLKSAAEMGARRCVIATETTKHLDDSLSALQYGLDLLIEKPLGVDAQEAKSICRAAAAANRNVFVGCTLRFAKSLNTFRDVLGAIGPVHSVRIECKSYLPNWRHSRPYLESYSAGIHGGVLRDLIHEVDYAAWLFGWPESVYAVLRNHGRLGIAAEESADLLWEMPQGPVVSISLDYLTRIPQRIMTACGELGTVSWNGISLDVVLRLGDGTSSEWKQFEDREEMLLNQDLAFVNAAQNAADSRLATAEDGVRALAVCDAARLASQRKRQETVVYD